MGFIGESFLPHAGAAPAAAERRQAAESGEWRIGFVRVYASYKKDRRVPRWGTPVCFPSV